jgi:protocatechuate 3,4-dioxygenase, alpha subunit
MKNMKQTPSQTVGPYFAYGLTPEQYLFDFKSLVNNDLSVQDSEIITIKGRVFDGNNEVIVDALLEIWDAENQLFGRFGTGTEPDGSYIFKATKPVSRTENAPFLSVILFMRGQLVHSYTRIYFENEPANTLDEELNNLPEKRKNSLIAKKFGENYVFDIYMQGENETVFFDI